MTSCLEFIVKEAAVATVLAGAVAAGNYFMGREVTPTGFGDQMLIAYTGMNVLRVAGKAAVYALKGGRG